MSGSRPLSRVSQDARATKRESGGPMDQPDDTVQTPATAESPEVEAELQADPPAAPVPDPKPRRAPGILVALLSGVVTAAAGFAGGVLLVQRYPELLGLTGGAGVDQRISDHDKRLTDLAAKLAGLESQPGSSAAVDALRAEQGASITDLAGKQDTLGQTLQALADRVGKLESLPVTASGDGAAAVAAQTAQAEANARAAQAAAQKLKDEADAATRRAALDMAIGSLTAALESGTALDPALSRLTEAGVAVPEALTSQAQGVPTLQALRSSFPDAARDALAQSLAETAQDGFWAKVGAFLRSQSGARSLTPRAGNDPDAILSRAEAALATDDLATALKEIAALPAAGQTRLSEWTGLANRRLAAKTAIAELSAAN